MSPRAVALSGEAGGAARGLRQRDRASERRPLSTTKSSSPTAGRPRRSLLAGQPGGGYSSWRSKRCRRERRPWKEGQPRFPALFRIEGWALLQQNRTAEASGSIRCGAQAGPRSWRRLPGGPRVARTLRRRQGHARPPSSMTSCPTREASDRGLAGRPDGNDRRRSALDRVTGRGAGPPSLVTSGRAFRRRATACSSRWRHPHPSCPACRGMTLGTTAALRADTCFVRVGDARVVRPLSNRERGAAL